MPVGFQLCPSLDMRERRRRGGTGGGGGAGEEDDPSATAPEAMRVLRRRVVAAAVGGAARASRGADVGEVGAPIMVGADWLRGARARRERDERVGGGRG